MKVFFEKVLAVAGFGLFFGFSAQAQDPVSTYPYESDFGTQENPGQDNARWRYKAFDLSDFSTVESGQWGIVPLPETSAQAVRFIQNSATEDQAAAFTPAFRLEKSPSVTYTVGVEYLLPAGSTFPSDNLTVRLHSVDASGEPFFRFDGTYYDTEDPISGPDGQISTFLHKHPGIPQTGSYSYQVSADQIPQDGDYRFSFIVSRAGKKAVKAEQVFYITGITVEKSNGQDLAAGQIQTPYSDPQANGQPFSAYVVNRGGGAVDGFTACYRIDGQEPVRQEFPTKVEPGKAALVVFTRFPDVEPGNHRLTFWVETDGDIDHANDTSSCLIKAGTQVIAGLPAHFGFAEEEPYGWTMRSDSIYAVPAWRFVKEGDLNRPHVSTENENARRNNDYVVSPPMAFQGGKMYRIAFTYAAVLGSDEPMGDLSLAMHVCPDADWKTLSSATEPLWKQDRFSDRGDRKVVVYYRAGEDARRVLAFHAYGPSAKGGLQIKSLSVALAEENTLDYFFEFDGNASADPQYLADRNLDFVDYDGNVFGDGVPGNWELYGNQSGHNSEYSARSAGLRGKTDDWLVFKPFYLQAGQTYYLNFSTKMSAANNTGMLEIYVQQEGPRYDLPYAGQPGVKRTKRVSTASYDTVRQVVEVPEDGYYLLSIRNVTDVPEMSDAETRSNYTVHVDNVSFGRKERSAVQAMQATVPYEARLGQSVSLSMSVRNFAMSPIDAPKVSYCYQIDDEAVCREHPSNAVQSQITLSYTFTRRAVFGKEGVQVAKFWVETEGSAEKPDTVRVSVEKIHARALPFVEKFGERSMDEWQSYPSSRNVWQAQYGTETARSGEWSVRCNTGAMAVSDYLVTPLLHVEKDKTYRISFFYKRAGDAPVSQNDTLRLSYAYDRYDNTGFLEHLAVFARPSSTDYDFCEAYVRFPDSGMVFIGLMAKLGGNAPMLYVDDFMVVDSLQTNLTYYTVSDLVVSGNMSECDTTVMGKLSFKVTAGGFSMPGTVPAYVRYDDGRPLDVSIRHEMMDGEETTLMFDMPLFSGGEHTVTAWIGLPDESDRSDDTLKASFTVRAPMSVPFKDGGIRIVGLPQMTDCFILDTAGVYYLRYRYDAAEASGSSLQLNLLKYGSNAIAEAIPVESVPVSGSQERKTAVHVSVPGVYAVGLACRNLADGGSLRIDSLWFEGTDGSDTVANAVFGKHELRLSPNPAGDFVEVFLPAQARHLALFDMQGRIRRRFDVAGQGSIVLPLADLAPGVYMIRVTGKDKAGALKLIKQ